MEKNSKQNKSFRSTAGFFMLLLVFFGISVCALRFGSVNISWSEFFDALFEPRKEKTASVIIYSVRLPRILAGLLAGVGLSVSGVLLQSVTDNSLASPNVIGVNAGAGFGTIICLAFIPASSYLLRFSLVPVFAFFGAVITTVAVIFISSGAGGSRSAIVLAGVAVTALLNAFISAITLADTDILASYNSFSVGGFSGVTYGELIIPAALIVLSLILCLFLSGRINLLSLGQDAASLLGVNVKALRIITIICASASAASVVSFAGLLGFVGLVVPHIARAFVGERVAFLLPTSAILGASVTVLADFIGRIIISPSEIPVGIMMAVIGAPFFIFLLFNKKGEY